MIYWVNREARTYREIRSRGRKGGVKEQQTVSVSLISKMGTEGIKGSGGMRSSQLSGGPSLLHVKWPVLSQVNMAQTISLSHRHKESSKRGVRQRVRSTTDLHFFTALTNTREPLVSVFQNNQIAHLRRRNGSTQWGLIE